MVLWRNYSYWETLEVFFNHLFFIMNIFIANVDFSVREDDLRAQFEEFGTVSSFKIITDRETGRSKGYGFAEMPDNDEGLNAISAMNGKEVNGRELVVKISRPK
jgi:RNA recognition motif-containing protein